jgi:oligosaccharide repeat unit polymerase
MQSAYSRLMLASSTANYASIFSWGGFVFSIFGYYFLPRNTSVVTRLAVYSAIGLYAYQGLISGGRSVVVLFVVALAFKQLLRAKAHKAILYGALMLGLISLVSATLINMRYAAQGAMALNDPTQTFFVRATTGLMFLDHATLSVKYARDVGHDLGQLYLNCFSFLVPRELWPDKPLLLSTQMQRYRYGVTTGGVPPGYFGEAFIAFGVIGIAIMSTLLGLALGAVDKITKAALETDCRVRMAFASIIAPLLGYALIRGGVDIGVIRVGIPAFWCGVALFLARRFRGQRSWTPPLKQRVGSPLRVQR